ncbi:MAG: hypothetical protein AAF384_13900 [Pseudomonadota bacterium]
MNDPIQHPGLNERARGWLRFIWEKATREEDWSSTGDPHPSWDRYSTAPMCAFPRFDVSETSYALPLMVDQTPAWREVYTRIADELVGRYTTFWGAVDWLTLIGPDPHQGKYPPEWLVYMPEALRGHYDPPGWTANGVAPWGLQPDPIAADGNLFFRGFFNLLLATYSYVSGDDKWERPFKMTGYQDRLYDWTQHSITAFIEDQWAERPQGAHCENTKVWPYCLSAAGLSLQLYDKIFDAKTHWVYDQWIDYAKQHFTTRNSKGDIESFAFYYDPIEKMAYSLRDRLAGYSTLAPLFYLYPQAPEFGQELYESGIEQLGWNKRSGKFVQTIDDPRWLTMVLMLAREIGDQTTMQRLTDAAEQEFGPDFFSDDPDRFAWCFGLEEPYPRGQLNGLMILSEIGECGAWTNVYTGSYEPQFDLPTVEGVDYPSVGVNVAYNDPDTSTLHVSTYAAASAERGKPTQWRVSNLPGTQGVKLYCDGSLFEHWRASGANTITIDSTVDAHDFQILWQGAKAEFETTEPSTTQASAQTEVASVAGAAPAAQYRPAAPPSCACC